MKGNYIKSYFKSFGIISFLVVLLAFLGVGALAFGPKGIRLDGATNLQLVKGGLIMLLGSITVVGLTSLKSNRVSFIDLLRVEGFLGSTGTAVMIYLWQSLAGRKMKLMLLAFAGIALLLLIQIIIRFIYCKEASESSLKGYFGALCRKYNPFVFVFGSALIAAVLFFFFKDDWFVDFVGKGFKIRTYQYMIIGGLIACMGCAFIPAFDSKQDVCLSDLVCAFGFLTTFFVLLTSVNYFNTRIESYKILTILFLAFMLVLIGRALTYTKPAKPENPKKKVSTYFKRVYERYDAVFQYLLGFGIFAFVAIPFVIAPIATKGTNPLIGKIFRRFITDANVSKYIFVVGVVAMLLCLGLFLIILFGKKKDSENIERVDAPLIPGLIVLAGLIPLGVMIAMNGKGEWSAILGSELVSQITGEAAKVAVAGNVILFGSLGFALLLGLESLVVTIIRIKNFTPAYEEALEVAEDAPAEEAVAEEAAPEEEVAEEPEEAVEDTPEEEEWEETIIEDEALEEEPVEEALEEEPVEEAEEAPVEEEAPAEEAVEEETPAEEEAPVAEEAVEETPAEEEAPVAEEVVEEEPVEEEAPVEAPVEVAPKAEPHRPTFVAADVNPVEAENRPKKIKRKFNTKMMYAPYETKEYYSEIKNYLMMYKAKGRCSSRCETFRHKGLVAKVALGGKAVKVYLALDPEIVNAEPRYHLKDCTDKKQYAEVPVMIKVRSARSLKYFKELVDMLMTQKEVKPKRNFKPVDYTLELIPNGEAILANLGMSTDYLQETMNARGIPAEMPDNLIDYIPVMADEAINEEIVETSIYLDTLCSHFDDGAVITLETLKELHIMNRGNVLRVKARGTLDRKLTIYADKFDEDALKMMMCTNCTAVRIIRE